MYQISFYSPIENTEMVKNAMFKAGAGKTYGNYEHCAWQTKGVGQFTPINNANPTIGVLNKVEKVEEYKVEMLCTNNKLDSALKAMKSAHEYEQVAYVVIKMENV